MLIQSIHEVRPGAKLAVGVMNPRIRDQELLKAGFVVDEPIIARLKSMDVTQVFVDFPGLEDLDWIVLSSLSPERKEIYSQIKSVITDSEQNVQPLVRYGAYVEATRNFVKTIIASPENAVLVDVLAKNDDAIEHAAGVAHVALVLGLKLDGYLMRERSRLPSHVAKDVTSLGVAAMLHDIGKSRLPKELRHHHSLNPPESDEAMHEWQKHAQYGFEMIRGQTDATTAAAVMQHHQHFDGTGFPELHRGESKVRMSECRIHCFARILRAADLFDRLSLAPDGTRRTNYEILFLMRTRYAKWLDPDVLAALPTVIPPFSPGRRVTLSDLTQAIVINFSSYAPYQPLVKRMNPSDMTVEEQAIDLRKGTLRVIALDGVLLETLERRCDPLAEFKEAHGMARAA